MEPNYHTHSGHGFFPKRKRIQVPWTSAKANLFLVSCLSSSFQLTGKAPTINDY